MTTVDDCLALMEDVRQEGMGPGRIALALECKNSPPIGDIARFLLSTKGSTFLGKTIYGRTRPTPGVAS